MALPDVTITVQDGSLGIVPASVANIHVKVGVCSGGVVNTMYSFTDKNTLSTTLGQGPLVEAAAHSLGVNGGPVYCMPINPSVAATVSAVVQAGTGTGTLAVTQGPAQQILVKMLAGTTQSTATFAVSVNGGPYGPTQGPYGAGPYTYAIPNTMTTLSLGAVTYTPGDVWTFATTGGIGTGGASSPPTLTSNVVDSFNPIITIVTSGALGAATFTYSVDGGNTTSATTLVPSTGKFAIPNTGIVLTFAGTFVAADTYTFTTTQAGYSNADVSAAFTALFADARQWGFVHIVGKATSIANAASLASVVDTQMTAAAVAYRFAFAVIEAPWDAVTNNDAAYAASTTFNTFASVRTQVCVGDCGLTSGTVSGRVLQRSIAWPYTARLALIPVGEDPGYVGRGSLTSVQSLYRNETATPGLDALRYVTLRTLPGYAGYYVTNGNLMAAAGSDFNLVQRRRVMDLACTITRAAELPFLNGSVRVDPVTGFIDPRDAGRFEARVNAQLKAGIVDIMQATSSTVQLNRTTNLLSTSSEPVTVRIVPLGYFKSIPTNIGFTNPAIAQ